MKKLLLFLIAIAMVVVVGCGGGSKKQPAPTTKTQTVRTGNQQYDGQNPTPACGFNGHLKNKYVVTEGKGQTVRFPGPTHLRAGRLILRHSTKCQTAVGEVFLRPHLDRIWNKRS